jgi:hypothetical protein
VCTTLQPRQHWSKLQPQQQQLLQQQLLQRHSLEKRQQHSQQSLQRNSPTLMCHNQRPAVMFTSQLVLRVA